jgi:hypothetical protein
LNLDVNLSFCTLRIIFKTDRASLSDGFKFKLITGTDSRAGDPPSHRDSGHESLLRLSSTVLRVGAAVAAAAARATARLSGRRRIIRVMIMITLGTVALMRSPGRGSLGLRGSERVRRASDRGSPAELEGGCGCGGSAWQAQRPESWNGPSPIWNLADLRC